MLLREKVKTYKRTTLLKDYNFKTIDYLYGHKEVYGTLCELDLNNPSKIDFSFETELFKQFCWFEIDNENLDNGNYSVCLNSSELSTDDIYLFFKRFLIFYLKKDQESFFSTKISFNCIKEIANNLKFKINQVCLYSSRRIFNKFRVYLSLSDINSIIILLNFLDVKTKIEKIDYKLLNMSNQFCLSLDVSDNGEIDPKIGLEFPVRGNKLKQMFYLKQIHLKNNLSKIIVDDFSLEHIKFILNGNELNTKIYFYR